MNLYPIFVKGKENWVKKNKILIFLKKPTEMKRILLPKKNFLWKKNERKSREDSFLRWRKKARNPRTSQDTRRRGRQVLVFHSARGSISLSLSLSLLSFLQSTP
jgi:hypothetical protein